MKFALKVVDACCQVREKYKRPDFIIGYRLSPEEPYKTGITMTETLQLVKALVTKPIQYIHISQSKFFQKTRRGEGAGQERLKVIHEITKGKMALIGVGGLKSGKDIKNALESQLCEFIAVGVASMMNRDLGILLKEKKYDKINLELDTEHPEIYKMPKYLWEMCLQGIDWMPPLKAKSH